MYYIKNLNDKRTQVALLINTADFDGKGLLKGDAQDLQVQVGLNVTDRLSIRVNDINNGKLFRSSIATALNKAIIDAADINAATTYYVNANAATQVDLDIRDNVNLFHAALNHTAVNAANGPRGSGAVMTNVQFGVLVMGLSAAQKALLNQMAPLGLAQIVATDPTHTFLNADANDLNALYADANAKAEFLAIVQDDAATNIATQGDNAKRVLAQDVFDNALNSIRTEQATVSNQKSNVVGAADALRATTNVTQKAADSYLKTDYVLTAQQYSETIRTMVAAITALQASNKIPEAAQRLIDALAR